MKTTIPVIALALVFVSCHSGSDPDIAKVPLCQFVSKPLTRDSSEYMTDDKFDTTLTYTYQTQSVSMDSLLTSLCNAGIIVNRAYYVTEYLCADSRGPLPVVVLEQSDDRMKYTGFLQGAFGRLACADQLLLYKPN